MSALGEDGWGLNLIKIFTAGVMAIYYHKGYGIGLGLKWVFVVLMTRHLTNSGWDFGLLAYVLTEVGFFLLMLLD